MTGSGTDVSWDKKGKGNLEVISIGGKIAEGADEWRKPFRIRNPNQAFGEALSQMLSNAKVSSEGAIKIATGTCTGEPTLSYSSKPLSYVVQLMDKYSNNFIADSLVKTLDHEVNTHSGTANGGLAFIRTELQKIGILTLGNKIAASDFITLMKQIYKEKLYLPEIFTSLPIAGVDGTLKKKYGSTDVAERLRGKTGTLSGVQSLVGVYPTEKGDWIAIAIVTNGSHGIPESEVAKFLSSQ